MDGGRTGKLARRSRESARTGLTSRRTVRSRRCGIPRAAASGRGLDRGLSRADRGPPHFARSAAGRNPRSAARRARRSDGESLDAILHDLDRDHRPRPRALGPSLVLRLLRKHDDGAGNSGRDDRRGAQRERDDVAHVAGRHGARRPWCSTGCGRCSAAARSVSTASSTTPLRSRRCTRSPRRAKRSTSTCGARVLQRPHRGRRSEGLHLGSGAQLDR